MCKFKVGDKVVAKEGQAVLGTFHSLTVGKVYTLTSIGPSSEYFYLDGEVDRCYHISRLELADPTQTLSELVAENVSLGKQIKNLEERLKRKKHFFALNAANIRNQIPKVPTEALSLEGVIESDTEF